MQLSTKQIIERLHILRNKLEDEGLYVRSNTVVLAIEEIERLQNQIEAENSQITERKAEL